MNYKAKRIRSGLSTYTIAKVLGIDWNKYKEVENKKINLEGKYLDNFLQIVEPKTAKMIKFNRNQKMREIKDFIKEGKLRDLMAKRGYNGMTLARELDYDGNVISQVLNGKYPSDDTVEYIYDFLINPINTNTTEEAPKEETPTEEASKKTTYTFGVLEQIKTTMKEKNISKITLARGTGISATHITNILCGKRVTSDEKMKLITDYVNNYTGEEKVEIKSNVKDLRKLKDEKGLSLGDIANGTGISYSSITKYFGGLRTLSKETEQKIADFLNNKEPIQDKKTENSENIIPKAMEEDFINIVEELKEEPIKEETKENQNTIQPDYFDLLKENKELKEELSKTQRQVKLYEILIERLK